MWTAHHLPTMLAEYLKGCGVVTCATSEQHRGPEPKPKQIETQASSKSPTG
jgi:hypothetical protein